MIRNPFNKQFQQELISADLFFEDLKKMTNNTAINSGLSALIALFGAGAVAEFSTHFWYAVVCAVVCVGCAITYELLP